MDVWECMSENVLVAQSDKDEAGVRGEGGAEAAVLR